jgi:hypothetical protein
MAQPDDEKRQLIEQLANTRLELNQHAAIVRSDLDVNRRVSNSIRKHTWGWVGFAAIFGWLLSRLPARKKKIYIHASSTDGRPPKPKKSFGAFFLGQAWNVGWTIAKPLLTAYLAKRIAEKD